MCFADDVMIFTKGNMGVVQVVKEILNEFSATFGLSISEHKSNVFMCGVDEEVGLAITQILNMPSGSFSIRYLGIPLHDRVCDALNYRL